MSRSHTEYNFKQLLGDSNIRGVMDNYARPEEKGINLGYTLLCDEKGHMLEGNLGLPVKVPGIFVLSTQGLVFGIKNLFKFGVMDEPEQIFNIGSYDINSIASLNNDLKQMKAGTLYVKPIPGGFEYIKIGMKDPKEAKSSEFCSESIENNAEFKAFDKSINLALQQVEKNHLAIPREGYYDPDDLYGHPSLARIDYTLRLVSQEQLAQYEQDLLAKKKDEIYIHVTDSGFQYIAGEMTTVAETKSDIICSSVISGKDARFKLEQQKAIILDIAQKAKHIPKGHPVYYAGYVIASPENQSIKIHLQSGRYQNNTLSALQIKQLESYIANVFLAQYNKNSDVQYKTVTFYPWGDGEQGKKEFIRYLVGQDVYEDGNGVFRAYNTDSVKEILNQFEISQNEFKNDGEFNSSRDLIERATGIAKNIARAAGLNKATVIQDEIKSLDACCAKMLFNERKTLPTQDEVERARTIWLDGALIRGKSALEVAVWQGKRDAVAQLLDATQKNMSFTQLFGLTLSSILYGQYDVFTYLDDRLKKIAYDPSQFVRTIPRDLFTFNSDLIPLEQFSLLEAIVYGGNAQIFDYFREKVGSSQFDSMIKKDFRNYMFAAIDSGKTTIIQRLVNIIQSDPTLMAEALDYAMRNDKDDHIDLLLKSGAESQLDLHQVLEYYIKRKNHQKVSELIVKGAIPSYKMMRDIETLFNETDAQKKSLQMISAQLEKRAQDIVLDIKKLLSESKLPNEEIAFLKHKLDTNVEKYKKRKYSSLDILDELERLNKPGISALFIALDFVTGFDDITFNKWLGKFLNESKNALDMTDKFDAGVLKLILHHIVSPQNKEMLDNMLFQILLSGSKPAGYLDVPPIELLKDVVNAGLLKSAEKMLSDDKSLMSKCIIADQKSSILTAISKNDIDLLNLFFKQGLSIDSQLQGRSLLGKAIETGIAEAIRLRDSSTDLSLTDGMLKMIRFLVEKGREQHYAVSTQEIKNIVDSFQHEVTKANIKIEPIVTQIHAALGISNKEMQPTSPTSYVGLSLFGSTPKVPSNNNTPEPADKPADKPTDSFQKLN